MFFKVTLNRSTIGVPEATRKIVQSLGLRKRGSVVYQQATPVAAGMIAKVKELVKVELFETELSKFEQKQQRKSNPGFTVEK